MLDITKCVREKNCGSEKNRQAKNGGVEGGSWWEREPHEEVGEEPGKVGWSCGRNGRGTIDEESGCAWSGGYKEKRKTETEMGGLREEILSVSGRGMENEGEG